MHVNMCRVFCLVFSIACLCVYSDVHKYHTFSLGIITAGFQCACYSSSHQTFWTTIYPTTGLSTSLFSNLLTESAIDRNIIYLHVCGMIWLSLSSFFLLLFLLVFWCFVERTERAWLDQCSLPLFLLFV
eukprot:scpid90203/ scgid9809/ 